jgi:hypothetical protein
MYLHFDEIENEEKAAFGGVEFQMKVHLKQILLFE